MILGNCITLSVRFDGETENYKSIVEDIGTFFSVFFIFEFCLKFFAIDFSYFRQNWNKFDFLIVLITCLDLIWNYSVLS